MPNLKITLISCLAFGFSVGCTAPTATTSSPPPSVEQQLSDRPGITRLSTDQLPQIATGQVIYVPVYSEIYDFSQARTFQLTATLSLHNTDQANPIVIETVDYYNSSGEMVHAYLTQPIQLAPLASTEVVIPKEDTTGGPGANFIVEWRAASEVSAPIAESIMISTVSQQGMSLTSQGRVIQER